VRVGNEAEGVDMAFLVLSEVIHPKTNETNSICKISIFSAYRGWVNGIVGTGRVVRVGWRNREIYTSVSADANLSIVERMHTS